MFSMRFECNDARKRTEISIEIARKHRKAHIHTLQKEGNVYPLIIEVETENEKEVIKKTVSGFGINKVAHEEQRKNKVNASRMMCI